MELSDIRQHLRQQLGLEVEPAMTAYIVQLLRPAADPEGASPPPQIPIIGADARTGVAVRRMIPIDSFNAVQP